MASPQRAAKFDDYATQYEALHQASITASGESPVDFADYKVNCLRRLGLPATATVLDYGCGIGNLTERLADGVQQVHGYDPSAKSLEVARSRAPFATYHQTHDQIPNAHFACAVLSGVLHHVPPGERKSVLQTVRSKLAPGGFVAVFEHNPWNPLTRHAVATCPFDDDAVLLWPSEAKRLVTQSGFARVSQDYIMFFPRALSALRGLEPRLGWLFAGAQTLTVGHR
jgi:2-polyprenyl-3-methyl-5-hydroxy-6-metoxy-1,4-benzoquinol methylase